MERHPPSPDEVVRLVVVTLVLMVFIAVGAHVVGQEYPNTIWDSMAHGALVGFVYTPLFVVLVLNVALTLLHPVFLVGAWVVRSARRVRHGDDTSPKDGPFLPSRRRSVARAIWGERPVTRVLVSAFVVFLVDAALSYLD